MLSGGITGSSCVFTDFGSGSGDGTGDGESLSSYLLPFKSTSCLPMSVISSDSSGTVFYDT